MPVGARNLFRFNHKETAPKGGFLYARIHTASTVGGFGGIFSASHFI